MRYVQKLFSSTKGTFTTSLCSFGLLTLLLQLSFMIPIFNTIEYHLTLTLRELLYGFHNRS